MKNRYTSFLIHQIRKVICVLMLLTVASCSEFIDVGSPKTEIVTATVFTSDASATSALRGIYSLMMTNNSFTKAGLEEHLGIASDELINYSTRQDQVQFYQNSLTPKNSDVLSVFWREAYKYIINANSLLEGISIQNGMTEKGVRQIEGEAKFIRAFCYFHLVYLFGDVPFLTTTDYRVNSTASRTEVSVILENIEQDLIQAQTLLSDDFSFSDGERIQPNKGAATALLARLYLYKGEWDKAELTSSILISNTTVYALISEMDEVFLANSSEAIWQLKPVVPGVNTPQGQLFILTAPPNSSSRRVSIATSLKDSFEDNDQRAIKWVGTFSNSNGKWFYPYKYKVALNANVTEYSMMLRLSEQYLIRAEARAHLNKISSAKEDLDIIRNRAGLENTTANDQPSVLIAIARERRAELFAESGHRWFDLKRTGQADAVLSLMKSDWQSTDVLFPIPESERLLNPNLTQNIGYQ